MREARGTVDEVKMIDGRKNKNENEKISYVADGIQKVLFSIVVSDKPSYGINTQKIKENYFYIPQVKENHIQLQNRRYIGSKHKLIEWIFSIIDKECNKIESFADIFAGTGVVGKRFTYS